MPTFSKPFLFVGLCSLSAASAFAQPYTLAPIGTLGGDRSIAFGLNASGQVVGSSNTSAAGPLHPFLWTNGVIKDLGLLPGFPACEATAVNDLTQVVGTCYDAANSVSQAFVWSPTNGMARLGTPSNALPTSINNHGDVVGAIAQSNRAFVFRDGTLTDLGSGVAYGINDNGQIGGVSFDLSRAVLWDASGMHDLGTVDGGFNSFGKGISPGGTVVGNSDQGTPGHPVAAVFTPYGVSNLGTLGGPSAIANAVRAGMVVGTAKTPSGDDHAFLYDLNGESGMVDLNSRVPANGTWILRTAIGVNASGTIAGTGLIFGHTQAFVLTPGTGTPPAGDLLLNGGFEEYTPPQLGPPGWISDDFRQVAAKSETNQPRSGEKNGACWTTDNLDCGMFQDLSAPSTGTYTLTIYANADRPGALVGANVGESTAAFTEVDVRGFANYGNAYVLTFTASKGQTIRIWMYSPAVPGYLVIDDATLTGPSS